MKFYTENPKPWKYYTVDFFVFLTICTSVGFAGVYALLLTGIGVVSYITLDKELLLFGLERIFNIDYAFFWFRISSGISFIIALLYISDTKYHKSHLEEYMKGKS